MEGHRARDGLWAHLAARCLPPACQRPGQGLDQRPPWLPKPDSTLSSWAHCEQLKWGLGLACLVPSRLSHGQVHTVGAHSMFMKPLWREVFTCSLDRDALALLSPARHPWNVPCVLVTVSRWGIKHRARGRQRTGAVSGSVTTSA